MTPSKKTLITELLACIREARRLNNQIVRNMEEVDKWHRDADRWLQLEPLLDDEKERFDYRPRAETRERLEHIFGAKRKK